MATALLLPSSTVGLTSLASGAMARADHADLDHRPAHARSNIATAADGVAAG